MLTLGVDLAAADERTALAVLEWSGDAAVVRDLRLGVSDEDLLGAFRSVDKAGIDCPLGWPAEFVSFLVAQQSGRLTPPPADVDGASWRRGLAYRVTDLVVREKSGGNPLSVSTDRIAHVAFRCAALLARLGEVDRSGGGVVVEVYPAAALRRWGLTHRGYKKPGAASLVDDLMKAAPWLSLGSFGGLCRTSHDAFDAVIAALAARAAALGQVLRPTEEQLASAQVEGWIALPTGELSDLLRGNAHSTAARQTPLRSWSADRLWVRTERASSREMPSP